MYVSVCVYVCMYGVYVCIDVCMCVCVYVCVCVWFNYLMSNLHKVVSFWWIELFQQEIHNLVLFQIYRLTYRRVRTL